MKKLDFTTWMLFTGMLTPSLAVLPSHSAFAANSCAELFARPAANRYENPRAAWTQSVEAMRVIRSQVHGMDNVLRPLMSAVVAHEFVWMNGDPGGAKTYLARLVFDSVLRTIPDREKKIFVLQFHKLIAEGKITGFPKFNEMMSSGRYSLETSSSLVGERFLFLIADEAEKANPATLNALLSVLNERKAFLGARVVDAVLASGVFTSNKTTGGFIKGFGDDRPSGEAFLDRNPIKIHMPNQFASASETVAFHRRMRESRRVTVDLPLMELSNLMKSVTISPEMMTDIGEIARSFDAYVTGKADDSRKAVRFGDSENEYFPANQFSNRSARRMVQVLKSAFIVEQLWQGVSFEKMRLNIERRDLNLLYTGAAYGGPLRIGHKQVELGSAKEVTGGETTLELHALKGFADQISERSDLGGRWDPWSRQLEIVNRKGRNHVGLIHIAEDGAIRVMDMDPSIQKVPTQASSELLNWIKEGEARDGIKLEQPQFMVSEDIDQLLKKETLPAPTRQELESIREDAVAFVQRLNQQTEKVARAASLGSGPRENGVQRREYRGLRRFSDQQGHLQVDKAYELSRVGVLAMKQRFPELSYSIEAHLTALLGGEHLYVFGPPGGAKTALAEVVLAAELRHINAAEANRFTTRVLNSLDLFAEGREFVRAILEEMRYKKPEKFKRFMLQFHKLIPEGVLTGFVKIDKQLDEGIEERNYADSLAGKEFIFAILDEVDKANPQTLTALLSLLNEREVLAGNEVVKAALQSAIMTSNKMTSELLESFFEDRANAEALMDRALNKVFVSNKFSTDDKLIEFLVDLEAGRRPDWKGVIALSDLRPLVESVTMDDALEDLIEKVREKFMARRLQASEKSHAAFKEDPRAYPDYYVPASTMSNRTAGKLMKQFKARFIVSQLMAGVPYEKLRTKVDVEDLRLYFEGMAYWSPQSFTKEYGADGLIEFKNDQTILSALAASPQVNSRTKFHINMMLEEGRDFTEVADAAVREFAIEYRELIAKYPRLFPSLRQGGE